MRKRQTFEELTNIIREDKYIIKLPNRKALQIEQWFKQPMAELTEHQRRRAAHDIYQHEIREVAMANDVDHAQPPPAAGPGAGTVSYTHLTLPTNLTV